MTPTCDASPLATSPKLNSSRSHGHLDRPAISRRQRDARLLGRACKSGADIRVDRHDSLGSECFDETAKIENRRVTRRVHAGEADLVLGEKLLQRGS